MVVKTIGDNKKRRPIQKSKKTIPYGGKIPKPPAVKPKMSPGNKGFSKWFAQWRKYRKDVEIYVEYLSPSKGHKSGKGKVVKPPSSKMGRKKDQKGELTSASRVKPYQKPQGWR